MTAEPQKPKVTSGNHGSHAGSASLVPTLIPDLLERKISYLHLFVCFFWVVEWGAYPVVLRTYSWWPQQGMWDAKN